MSSFLTFQLKFCFRIEFLITMLTSLLILSQFSLVTKELTINPIYFPPNQELILNKKLQ